MCVCDVCVCAGCACVCVCVRGGGGGGWLVCMEETNTEMIINFTENEQSNRTPRCSQKVSAAGLSWLKHFRVQCYT